VVFTRRPHLRKVLKIHFCAEENERGKKGKEAKGGAEGTGGIVVDFSPVPAKKAPCQPAKFDILLISHHPSKIPVL
jgi:hypothetical protein